VSNLVVSSNGLTKRYGTGVLAVDRISLSVGGGEIYALLGLNGAGKSTTIRMLLAMITPTAGTVELFGRPIKRGASDIWRRVGHLIESATVYPELTVRENVDVARRLVGVDEPDAVDRLVDRLGLREYGDRRAGFLSLGNKQRLALATALVGDPELLVLDEPANGLDPAGVIEIRELLRGLAIEDGVTVFMSSHILAEVDQLATRIGILHQGRLIEEVDGDALDRNRDRRLEIGARDLAALDATLRRAGFSTERVVEPGRDAVVVLRDHRAVDAPDEIARILAGAGVPPTHLAVVRESLEEHFMRVIARADPTQ
jgi:ABC-2 type transport system ATP-binding protein